MGKNHHTPGPWSSGAAIPITAKACDKSGFSLVFVNRDDKSEPEANARLIAAAPELLEALREALDCIRVYAPDYMHGMPRKHYVSQARAAIAKATGVCP